MKYAGFWRRALASVLDTLVITLFLMLVGFTAALIYALSEEHFNSPVASAIQSVVFLVYSIWFWVNKGATPGKQVLGVQVVDATTGQPLTVGKALLRYFGYIVATLPLGLGILWVAFDKRKQGWHDKIAGSVVIHREAPTADNRF